VNPEASEPFRNANLIIRVANTTENSKMGEEFSEKRSE